MNSSSLNIQKLAHVYDQLQNQLANSQSLINDLQNLLLRQKILCEITQKMLLQGLKNYENLKRSNEKDQ